jgi:hypothetical protein
LLRTHIIALGYLEIGMRILEGTGGLTFGEAAGQAPDQAADQAEQGIKLF